MNPHEHYRRAEEILESCRLSSGLDETASDGTPIEVYSSVLEDATGDGDPEDTCRNALMAAQVHAILALVANQDADA